MFCKHVNGKSQLKFKIILSVLAISFVAFLFVPETFAAEKTALKLNLKPGQKYKRVISMEEKISQSMAGQKMDIDHTKKVGFEFEVKDVDAKGVASVKVTYRTIQEETSSTGGNFEYDSADPNTHEGNPLANTYTAMMGEGFIVKVADNGKIVELTGFDKMLSRVAEKIVVAEDEMISKLPPGQCAIDKNKAANRKESQEELAKRRIDGMNKMYGSREGRVKVVKELLEKNPTVAEEQVRLMLICVMTPFPNEPVQSGDSWTDKVDLKAMMLPVEIESVYTLKEDEGDTAIISSSFESKMKDPAIDYGAGPIQGKMKMEGSYQRSSEIDKLSGWVTRSSAKLNISGKIKMPSNPQMPQGMTVPITVKSTVTVEPMKIAPEQETSKPSVSPVMEQFLRMSPNTVQVTSGDPISTRFEMWEAFLQHKSMNINFEVEAEGTVQKDHVWKKKTHRQILDEYCQDNDLVWKMTGTNTIRIEKKSM